MSDKHSGGEQTILTATDSYEAWLRACTQVNEKDIQAKHALLAEGTFPFLRGTFYRWMQIWPELCKDLADAPQVLAVGDLHVENFGTWRDAEGRLAWGVNDFDEAFELPFTIDLVRLATSALVAFDANHISVDGRDACERILKGYTHGIKSNGKPFVIDEENRWFIDIIQTRTPDPVKFWQKLRQKVDEESASKVPPPAAAALTAALPAGVADVRMVPRSAGVGSLGKPRFVALATWLGGPVAREIKALVPSAVVWARGLKDAHSYIPRLVEITVNNGVRCPDPFFKVGDTWVRRRLAPDSHKIELKTSAKTGYGPDVLEAMGAETANVHLGTSGVAGAIQSDLSARGGKWLYHAATVMHDATVKEQQAWVKGLK
jgi:hypothetical protein